MVWGGRREIGGMGREKRDRCYGVGEESWIQDSERQISQFYVFFCLFLVWGFTTSKGSVKAFLELTTVADKCNC